VILNLFGAFGVPAIAYVLIRRGHSVAKTIRGAVVVVAQTMVVSLVLLAFLAYQLSAGSGGSYYRYANYSLEGIIYSLGFVATILGIVFLLQYLISPFIATRGMSLRVPGSEEAWLYDVLEEVKRSTGFKGKIKLLIAETDYANAFAVSNIFTKRIAVTRGLLKTLNRDEVKAVIAHELGHIANRDTAYMLAVSLIPSILLTYGFSFFEVGRSLMYAASYDYDYYRSSYNSLAALISMIIGFWLIVIGGLLNLPVLGFSRLREHLADIYSVKALRNTLIAQALQKIEAYNTQLHQQLLAMGYQIKSSPNIRKVLYIAPAPAVIRWSLTRSTHPPTEARIFIVHKYYEELMRRSSTSTR
jgi:heat shock protein HtpX